MKEFKTFAVKGNLVDIAVAFVMGASFGKLVTSLVDGMVMPLIGVLTGGVNFNDKVWVLKEGVTVKYGSFITALFDFVIVAFCMFLLIKAINRLKKEAPAPPVSEPPISKTDQLLMEIRDKISG